MTLRFTNGQIRDIRRLAKLYSYNYIAKLYNCSEATISNIVNYRIYADVDPKDVDDTEVEK